MAFAISAVVFLRAMHTLDRWDPDRARKKGQPIPVRTTRVTETQVEDIIGGTATTADWETGTVQVGASTGFNTTELLLKAIHAREGDFVKKGQVVMELDDRVFRRVLKQQELAVASATLTLERTKVQVEHAQNVRERDLANAEEEVSYREKDYRNKKREYELDEQLYQKKVISVFDLLDAKSTYQNTIYSLATAKKDLAVSRQTMAAGLLSDEELVAVAATAQETAKVALVVAQRDVERCLIRAPNDGFMDQVTLAPGQVIVPNTTLSYVHRLDPVLVRMDFPQERIGDVAVGQQAEVVLDSFPRETFYGTVLRISSQVNTAVRTLPVVLEVSNPQNRIKAGTSGFARIKTTKKSATVPSTALIQQGGKSMVFCVKEGRAQLREIQTGPVADTAVIQVRSGLAPGEEVVIFNNFYWNSGGGLTKRDSYLRDNDPVDTDWRGWARRNEE